MIIYVVCEDYTCAFEGLFIDKKEADRRAKEIGGYVIEYNLKGC